MSPILVRPVREQLEHDRVIRLLQAKYKRKFEVGANPGNEQSSPVGTGPSAWFPDVVLYSADRNRKLAGVVEVETTESVNNLEAMSQWAAFARFGVPFHLYLPTASVDTARRFCADLGLQVAEMWAYQSVGEQVRFTLVHRTAQGAAEPTVRSAEAPPESRPRAAATPARRRTAEPAGPPAAPARAVASPSRANGKTASRPARSASPVAARRASAGKAVKTAARRPPVKTARKAAKTAARTTRAAKRR